MSNQNPKSIVDFAGEYRTHGVVQEPSKKDQRRPLHEAIVLTIAVIQMLLSMSGIQIKVVLRAILDAICYGDEPNMTSLSRGSSTVLPLIFEQIRSRTVANEHQNRAKTPQKTIFNSSRSAPAGASGGDINENKDAQKATALSLFNQIKNKIKKVLFLSFFPAYELDNFERWLKDHPEKCQTEAEMMAWAKNWKCNTPKEQWPWADNMKCRQLVKVIAERMPDNQIEYLRGITNVEAGNHSITIVVTNEEVSRAITNAIDGQLIWGCSDIQIVTEN